MEIVLAEHKYATIKIELFNPNGEEEAEGWVSDIVNEYDKQKDGSYLLTDRKTRAVINWCYDWVYKTVENDNKSLYSHGWRLEMEHVTTHIAPLGQVTFFFPSEKGEVLDFRL